MEVIRSYLINNPCYIANANPSTVATVATRKQYTTFQERGPLGLMLHSVGTPQPKASVFLGLWNKSTYKSSCVHAIIDANTGDVYQCLPWNYRGWHAGSPANESYIGVEMAEPDTIKYTSGAEFVDNNPTKTKEYVLRTYNSAVELFASICKTYKLDPLKDGVILSHREGNLRGIATNHGDPDHLWKKFGLTMDQFRKDVNAKMSNPVSESKSTTVQQTTSPDTLSYDDISVGTIYKFTGTQQYVASTSKKGISAKSNVKVKVTSVTNKRASHPISVRSVNDKGNFISGVYGWVDIKDLEKIGEYRVQVTADSLNIRSGPGTTYGKVGTITDKGIYTIVENSTGWGKLKSGVGWIYLGYTKTI